MRNYANAFVLLISYFFVLLFVYASVNKILDFENFQVQIAQSPVLTAYAGLISYAVITVELLIAAALCHARTRSLALLASASLMTAFTVYIFVILNYSEFVPCSCGGILEKLGWKQHMVFNIFCVIAAIAGYIVSRHQAFKPDFKTVLSLLISNGGFGAVVVLLFMSSEYFVKKQNNFTRRFIPHAVYGEQIIRLQSNTYYFAGHSGDTLFLGNRIAPLVMATISPAFNLVKKDTLSISDYHFAFKAVELNVRYPFFSLSDGNVPVLFEGQFPNRMAKESKQPIPFYTKIQMAEPYHYILKTTLTENKEAVMALYKSKTGTLQLKPAILEKQIDGLFDTDGDFALEYQNKKMIYTYYYRNEYIVTDLQLDQRSAGHTIDTVTKAKLQVKNISTGERKMGAPPLEVNQMQAVYGKKLYNVAQLRGKFESLERWKEANIIDVYDYGEKTYQHSFYVYHYEKQKIRDFLVTKDYLYVLSGDKLIRYKLRL